MGSGKAEKPSKNPKKKRKPLAPNRAETKPKSKSKHEKNRADLIESKSDNVKGQEVQAAPAAEQQLSFFVNQFQSANKVQLSSLELDSMKDTCIVELSQDMGQDVESLGNHMKAAFGPSWKESLCEKQLLEGKVDPGSPALLIISSSALRSIQLLKGFRSLTRDCRAVKLFSKHMKVEEQIGKGTSDAEIIHLHIGKGTSDAEIIHLHVSMLKNRVNIASGTPSRIKKLIDIEALGLSRLAVILLDIHPDVKGYSLLTLPQIRDEFWDLYKNYFHQRLLQGDMRLCLYGPLPSGTEFSGRKRKRGATED